MVNFSAQHSSNLSKLLSTTPLVAKLNELNPGIDGQNIEQTAMSARELKGYERCIKNIVELSEQTEKAPLSSPYVRDLDKFEQAAQLE